MSKKSGSSCSHKLHFEAKADEIKESLFKSMKKKLAKDPAVMMVRENLRVELSLLLVSLFVVVVSH
jgi:hypothetical protein